MPRSCARTLATRPSRLRYDFGVTEADYTVSTRRSGGCMSTTLRCVMVKVCSVRRCMDGHRSFQLNRPALPASHRLLYLFTPPVIYPPSPCHLNHAAWIISQAVGGGGGGTLCHSPLTMATPNDANRSLPSAPPVCIHMDKMWLEPSSAHDVSTPAFGTRRFYLYSLAECRSPKHLLESLPELVEVSSSVPVALVIKMAGST